jgi:hypothetical protein
LHIHPLRFPQNAIMGGGLFLFLSGLFFVQAGVSTDCQG